MKQIKSTAESAMEAAERSLGLAVLISQSLSSAADATWPPTVPSEIEGQESGVADRKPIRSEWDFRLKSKGLHKKVAQFEHLQNAEVLACHQYEIARDEKRWLEEAVAWRNQCEDKKFSGFLKFWCDCWRSGKKHPHTEYYVLWPEWPATPYLEILPEVRRKRLELWTGHEFKYEGKPKHLALAKPPLTVVAMAYLFAHRDILWEKPTWYNGPFEDAVLGETITFTGKKTLWKTREYVAFDLNWVESNDNLVERFRQWVERQRNLNGIKPREFRGAASLTNELRSDLIALGAWRLVKVFGKSVPHSITYSQQMSGDPLYENPETWFRNLKRVTGPLGILWETS